MATRPIEGRDYSRYSTELSTRNPDKFVKKSHIPVVVLMVALPFSAVLADRAFNNPQIPSNNSGQGISGESYDPSRGYPPTNNEIMLGAIATITGDIHDALFPTPTPTGTPKPTATSSPDPYKNANFCGKYTKPGEVCFVPFPTPTTQPPPTEIPSCDNVNLAPLDQCRWPTETPPTETPNASTPIPPAGTSE